MSLIDINPDATLSRVRLHDGRDCLVVDNFLLHPEAVRQYAAEHRESFAMLAHNRFPGPEVVLSAQHLVGFLGWWRRVARSVLGLSRIVHQCHARMSIVTLAPEQLSLRQRLCHRDGSPEEMRGNILYAGVLYLFHDDQLGGTAFYRNIDPEWRSVVALAERIGEPAVSGRYPFFSRPPGYLTDGCEFFECTNVVPPKFNRVIFYPGDIFHSGYITHPEYLSDDPLKGRLTINFFLDTVKPV